MEMKRVYWNQQESAYNNIVEVVQFFRLYFDAWTHSHTHLHAYTPMGTRIHTNIYANVIWNISSAEYAYPLYPYFAIKYLRFFECFSEVSVCLSAFISLSNVGQIEEKRH